MFLHREWDEDKNTEGLGPALGLINPLVVWGVKDSCKSSNRDFLVSNHGSNHNFP